jgi:sodium/potassium-transporting ATPase subunit alpha
MVFGVLIELLLICLFVYMPGVRFIMGAEPPPHFIWLFSLVVGLVLLFFNEMRKYFIRKYPQNAVVRIFKW